MELEILKKALVEVLSVDASEIHMETTFLGDLGADSLDVYQVILKLEDALGIQFAQGDIKGIETVGQAVGLIKELEKKTGYERAEAE